ncbi:MAG: flagellar motor protein MotB [Gemmatimonas sp.]|jgi:chemotaxis protein MotB|uniref:flagellar motor protein MotB n=1 Tax=Gemmatimonas sp. TaxID=1962908 RepID=UPI00391FC0AA|nr:OmpA family protein [Gemmatimonadota bacterium]
MAARGGKKIVIVKKKVGGGGGHHGGSWKVAYADFVTAMMAFFMVMWILGMDDKTKQAIEGYFANPVGYKKGFGAGSSPVSTGSAPSNLQKTPLRMIVRSAEQKQFENLRRIILEKLAASDSLRKLNALVDVQVTKEGLRIELVESGKGDVYFPIGSSRMNSATMLTLQLVGTELAQLSNPVVLEGHTDGAKFGKDAAYTNWELSTDRANAARRVLESTGVDGSRVLEVRGYADTKPRVFDDPLAAANRRISILLPFTNVPESAPNAEALAAAKQDSLVSNIAQPPQRDD